jgi:hypothetical protein
MPRPPQSTRRPTRQPWTLYRRNRGKTLDLDLFRRPTAEYRGAPFWSWNNKLDIDQLLRQIEQFRAMGFGGANIHSRTGLDTQYLGDEFMDMVRACTQRLADRGMLSWLYDEDRWPSGFAGGLVTKDPAHRVRHLLFTTVPYESAPPLPKTTAYGTDYGLGVRSNIGDLLAIYDVELSGPYLRRHRRHAPGAKLPKPPKNATRWYAYMETPRPATWFGGQTYVNVFSKPAIERFIETTHERYREAVGDFFGGAVPAMFTDEPQFAKKQTLGRAGDPRDVILSWSPDLQRFFGECL